MPENFSQQTKVLVADDSPIYRKLVEYTLSSEGYTVVFAKNGREAIELVAEHHPAVVITDWTMPDISGLELCQLIRHDFHDSYIHVILLTGNTDKEEVVEGLAVGADDYLTKPFHSGELQARVRVGCRIRRTPASGPSEKSATAGAGFKRPPHQPSQPPRN